MNNNEKIRVELRALFDEFIERAIKIMEEKKEWDDHIEIVRTRRREERDHMLPNRDIVRFAGVWYNVSANGKDTEFFLGWSKEKKDVWGELRNYCYVFTRFGNILRLIVAFTETDDGRFCAVIRVNSHEGKANRNERVIK